MKKLLVSLRLILIVLISVVTIHNISKDTEDVPVTTEEITTYAAPYVDYNEFETESSAIESTASDTNSDTEMPRECDLKLTIIDQYPELPAGCESVSLTMILNYYGYDLEKTDIADNYLIYSGSYLTGYYGNPYSYTGGGCYAPGMTDTANSFLQANGNEYYAKNITGTSLDDLFTYIASGTPVLIWTTIGLGGCSKDYSYAEYSDYDDTAYYWDYMEHCVVLTGYDLDNDTVTVYDPIEGIMTRDRERFEYIYDEMYRMSVILIENN